jgi:Cu-Zn family superoxide dismutase
MRADQGVALVSLMFGVGLLVLGRGAGLAVAQQSAPTATVDIRDRLSRSIGTVSLREEQGGVRITGFLRNMAPGSHGLHVHSVGQCLSPSFASAGPIFNPSGKKHGLRNPAGPEVGDLPALVVGADGTANLDAVVRGATISSGSTALLGGAGTTLIIHSGDDDQITEPEGNSGDRSACGVVLPTDAGAASATAQSRSPGQVANLSQPTLTTVPKPAAAQPPSAAQPAAASPRSGGDSGNILTSPLLAAALGVVLLVAGYFVRRRRRE